MKYLLRVERRILWGHCGVSTSRPLGFANLNLLDYELHSQDTRIRHEMDHVDRLIYGLNIAAAFDICTTTQPNIIFYFQAACTHTCQCFHGLDSNEQIRGERSIHPSIEESWTQVPQLCPEEQDAGQSEEQLIRVSSTCSEVDYPTTLADSGRSATATTLTRRRTYTSRRPQGMRLEDNTSVLLKPSINPAWENHSKYAATPLSPDQIHLIPTQPRIVPLSPLHLPYPEFLSSKKLRSNMRAPPQRASVPQPANNTRRPRPSPRSPRLLP